MSNCVFYYKVLTNLPFYKNLNKTKMFLEEPKYESIHKKNMA